MRLFLIDGHALIFKMYYAFLGRPMVNSKGEDTSILYGFTKYLLELINKEKPTHLAVSFDPPGGTFRNELYPAYKANRTETPRLVIDALEPLTEIVASLNIPVLMVPGFEADDVICSAALKFASEKVDVYMVTPDKDYGQMVRPHIYQFRPGKSGGENELLGEKEVCEKWNITSCSQVIDMLALCGDSSDNVPGVQGVGPVGAAKLLAKYGSLDGIYAHIGELTAKQQEKFREAEDYIQLSRQLVTIKTDVPVDTTLEAMAIDTRYSPEVNELFDRYEFPSLKKMVVAIAGESTGEVSQVPAFDYGAVALKEVSPASIKAERIGLEMNGDLLSVTDGSSYASAAPQSFRNILEDESVVKAGFGIKRIMLALHSRGIELRGRLEDPELMHYLINPERSHKSESLLKEYLGVDVESLQKATELDLFDQESPDEHSCLGLALLLPLVDKLKESLSEVPRLMKLYDELEEPLIGVLARMEIKGVKVDLASLSDFAESLRESMQEREREVREIAGDPGFNVASPKQVGELVFEKLALDPKARKPKKGNWPTDEQTLQELSDRSPVIEAILDYRGLRKLLSTYIEPFGTYVSRLDGRVHTTFNQALTSTGRLSSSNPNLQNIPIRSDQGREIRKAFVAGSPDCVMMSADYSQIELRLMAHFSGDEHLIAAFRAGEDIHKATAAKIFKTDISLVDDSMRRIAKTANFGIMYGISAFGLSQRLKCSRQEAKKIIDDYFDSFPSIRDFIDGTVSRARELGYVETLFGRRRYIPELKSPNAAVRSLGERNAVNAPVQGTAADIIKLAMNAVDRRLRQEGLKAAMVLQIHDELLLEVPVDEIDKVKAILTGEMENVVALSVPLTIECNYGKNWLDAH